MNGLPIVNKLVKQEMDRITSFHVPGHKYGRIYKRLGYSDIINKLGELDTTEVIGMDNLHYPTGIIKESQQFAKEAFRSRETFFLINGSTSGIYSMIMTVASPGDKIIVNRNCHQSVIQACILGDLEPIYVYPEIDYSNGIALGIDPEDVEREILLNKDVKAVLITYPTYEGVASDLKKIAEIVHKYDKILLVDEAHGAHFGLSQRLPQTALSCGADIVVQSTHKTLPALTQGAMLHVSGERIDIDRLKFMLRLNQSSSPSYMIMASLELAVTIYSNHGQQLMEQLLENIERFAENTRDIEAIELLQQFNGTRAKFSIDPTKLFISIKKPGLSGIWLEEYLRKCFNIQMELAYIKGILGVSTIANEKEDFNKLVKALKSLDKLEEGQPFRFNVVSYPKTAQVYKPREALYKEKTTIDLNNSLGKVSGEYVIPYPPGIPLIIPGEVITEEVIRFIKTSQDLGINIVGLKDKKKQFIDII